MEGKKPTTPTRPTHWTHNRDHFFKYTTRSAAQAILTNGMLRWSIPTLFNDPFDIQFDLHVDVNWAAVRSKALNFLWGAHYSETPPPAGNKLGYVIAAFRGRFPKLDRAKFDQMFGESLDEGHENAMAKLPNTHAEIKSVLFDSKLLSLTEVNNNILMWSHYAEQHKGVVLQLRCIAEIDSPWGVAKPVQYTETMPRLFDDEFLARMISGQTTMDNREIAERIVYSKAIDWAYEKEWRIWGGSGRSKEPCEDIPFNPRELEAVILGCKMSKDDRLSIIEIVRRFYPHANIVRAQKAEREFRLIV